MIKKLLKVLILFINKVIMNTLNAVILIVLFLSPFIYLPIISKQIRMLIKAIAGTYLLFQLESFRLFST